MYIRRLNTFFAANRCHKNTICSCNRRRTLCDGSPDLWDGQPLPPETVGDAAGVSHAPAPVLHRGGLSVGPPPTEHVDPGQVPGANNKRVTACRKLTENDMRPDKRCRLSSTRMSQIFFQAFFCPCRVRLRASHCCYKKIPGRLGRVPSTRIWCTNALHSHTVCQSSSPSESASLSTSTTIGVLGGAGGKILCRRSSA